MCDLGQHFRVEVLGLLDQERLDGLVVFGLDRRGQGIDGVGDDPGVRCRDAPGCLRGCDPAEDRRQDFTGQATPRPHIGCRVHPVGRLAGTDPQQLAQQRRGVLAAVFTGSAPGVDLGDQQVIGDGEPAFLGFQIAQQGEQGVVGQGGQLQGLQFVHRAGQPCHDRCRAGLTG